VAGDDVRASHEVPLAVAVLDGERHLVRLDHEPEQVVEAVGETPPQRGADARDQPGEQPGVLT
jgi:3-methyladenine DNA glycosylase/8-oxoguanine DNA glycosylase